jgi:hypothetical protein
MILPQTPAGPTTFGYLSAVESAQHGFFGGYLLVCPLGRPIEFHCTAPVRPSRAQQILYGPTLEPYLLGEQIAGTLLAKSQSLPQIILTDQPSTLCHRAKVGFPIVHLIADESSASTVGLSRFVVDGHSFALAAGYGDDREPAVALLSTLAKHVELSEPFARIHEAIREAQRIGAREAGTHADAA